MVFIPQKHARVGPPRPLTAGVVLPADALVRFLVVGIGPVRQDRGTRPWAW